ESRHTQAVEALDAVLKEEPNNFEALEKLTDALAGQRSARLLETAEHLLALDAQNAKGLYHLATIRLYQGRADEAIQLAKRSLGRDPGNIRARNLLAIAYGQTFQPALSEAEFQRAIAQAPEDSTSYNNYGIFLLERNKIAEARRQFGRAISVNPEDVQGFVGMGETFRNEGDLRKAGDWYRKALRLDPNQPVAKQYVK
ncbi:MAG: tetratricopeptide repeat protein, partial [Acidobacteria bacterium]|nr:tetratricopeptide repeat protein [Acidobacteriota bacterium]